MVVNVKAANIKYDITTVTAKAGQPVTVNIQNMGALDATAKATLLYLAPHQLKSAPVFPTPLPVLPTTCEDSARTYWKRQVRVGKLSTECLAGGTTVIQKDAYATELLGAELKDGNRNLLGTVKEGILEPETGKLGFSVVDLTGKWDLVTVPLDKTNIPEGALQPGSVIEPVLLADNKQLAGAPRITSIDQAASAEAQSSARGYWEQRADGRILTRYSGSSGNGTVVDLISDVALSHGPLPELYS